MPYASTHWENMQNTIVEPGPYERIPVNSYKTKEMNIFIICFGM